MEKGQYLEEKTSVWWDIEKIGFPTACDPHLIAQNIRSLLANLGYNGRVTISAYVDTTKISNSLKLDLISTGITVKHVPAGDTGTKVRRKMIYNDMMAWSMYNRAPANYLLISDDYRYFSLALHSLRDWGFNIILEHPPNGPQAEWEWLLSGILPSSSVLSGDQKVRGKRGRPSSTVSSRNQKVCGKQGHPSSGVSSGNQMVRGKRGRLSSSVSSGNLKVCSKRGRPSCGVSSGNQKVCGKRGRPSSIVSSGDQKVRGKRGRPSSSVSSGDQKVRG